MTTEAVLWLLLLAGLGIAGYTTFTVLLYRECKDLKHGGRVRPILLWCLWPFGLVAMLITGLVVKRSDDGPDDQITLDDIFMSWALRRNARARILLCVQRLRRDRWTKITYMRMYQELSDKLEAEEKNRDALVRAKAFLLARRVLQGHARDAAGHAEDAINKHFEETIEAIEKRMTDEP